MQTLNKLIVIGSGAHAENILSLIKIYYPETKVNSYSWETIADSCISRKYSYFVGIGDNQLRMRICHQIIATGAELVTLNFSNTVFADTQNTCGNLFMPNSYISPLASIGSFSIFNTCCVVEHHSIVGSACHIAPGATICGSVEIGDSCLIGANSTILPKSHLKSGLIVKAGLVVKQYAFD